MEKVNKKYKGSMLAIINDDIDLIKTICKIGRQLLLILIVKIKLLFLGHIMKLKVQSAYLKKMA